MVLWGGLSCGSATCLDGTFPPLLPADLKDVGTGGPDPFGNYNVDLPLPFPTGLEGFPMKLEGAGGSSDVSDNVDPGPPEPSQSKTGAVDIPMTVSTRSKDSKAREPTGSSGHGSRDLSDKTVRKQLALQEKNRRAQRRFRERQKQKVCLCG